ncbi:MAG: hypothetical protein KGS10_05490 [Chloroflexi bacterium]|nr:hypothetical protein [Chloroflexota bacterium]
MTTPAADAASKTKAALDGIRDLFETLVPPATLQISDVYGNTYTVRGRIPARTQILVMRELDRLMEVQVDPAMGQALAGGIAGAVRAVVTACSDPRVLSALVEAFAVAHPGAVESALGVARANGDPANDAADVFGLEEMAAALLPFFVALAKRTSTTLASAVPSAPPNR